MYERMLLFATFLLFAQVFSEDILVDVTQGKLTGSVKYDRKQGAFYSFQTIPFAKPPIGELRFKDPEAATPWEGTLDATNDLPKCVQFNITANSLEGREDCLYLNVYTPTLNVTASKAVMVWLYGGAFSENSGREDLYSPEFLLAEDIVLVTVNYRLGIFGSFSLENATLGTPGNAHLKDQSLGIRWVKENVMQFGGDPTKITIFGESAGGASVHLHVLSPRSEGLFQGAIMQSGVGIAPWVKGVQNNGLLLAKALDIPIGDPEFMLAALRTLPVDAIFVGASQISTGSGSINGPVIEKQTDGTAFLPKEPFDILESGSYNHVPMIMGYNDAEGIAVDQANKAIFGESILISDFYTVIPADLEIENGTEKAVDLAKQIKQFYYGDSTPTIEDMKPFIQIYTDTSFSFATYRAATMHLKNATEPIFFYRFSMDTLLNVYKRRLPQTALYTGASHCDDLGYLFDSFMTPEIISGSVEDVCVDRMVKLWTNFAKYGNPTPEGWSFQWKPISDEAFNYLDLSTDQSESKIDPDAENMKFWTKIYATHFRSSAFPINSVVSLIIYSSLLCLLLL